MNPISYCEALILQQNQGGEHSAAFTRSILFGMLHAYFKQHPEQYAIDILPDRLGLRVFTTTPPEIDALRQHFFQQSFARDYLRLTETRLVPNNYSGPWVTCSRFRIPTLKSDRHEGPDHGQLRARRLAQVTRGRMTHFSVTSKSTNQAFSLCVQRTRVAAGMQDAKPNSYGLSSTMNPCPVPDLPV